MSVLARLAVGVYRLMLAAYPGEFRAEFGAEMESVFADRLHGAAKAGWQNSLLCFGRELRDLPSSVFREHLQSRRTKMTGPSEQLPLKSGDLAAALSIFLVPPLGALLAEIVGTTKLSEWAGPSLVAIFLGSVLIPLILAITRGFPRWAPPYLGVLLLGFTFFVPFWEIWGWIYPAVRRWLGAVRTWSLSERIFVQGMQAAIIWLLMLLSTIILVFILRLIPHTRALWARIRLDWTQLSFFLYGSLVVHVRLIFDEYQRDEPWLIAAWLVLATGCWFYLHSEGQTRRIWILLGGATLAMWIVAAGKLYLVPFQNWGPWFERYPPITERWFESLSTLADWFCLVIALLLPSLLNLLPQKPRAIPEKDPALA